MNDNILEIKRGTTPTITMNMPEEIPLVEVVDIWVSISQITRTSVPVINKTMNDCTIDYDNKIISVLLSQEDTLRLLPTQNTGVQYNLSTYIEISLKFSDGSRATSNKQLITVLDNVKEGVM